MSFKSALEHAARQVGGDVSLEFPTSAPPSILEDQTALGELEHVLEGWTTTIQQVSMEGQADLGIPLAEVTSGANGIERCPRYMNSSNYRECKRFTHSQKVDAHAIIGLYSYGELQN